MRLSAKTEYAALAAVELARRVDARAPVRIREICAAQGVPPSARFAATHARAASCSATLAPSLNTIQNGALGSVTPSFE